MSARTVIRIDSGFEDSLRSLGLRQYEDFLSPSGARVVSEVRDRVVFHLPSIGQPGSGFYLKVFRNRGANKPLLQLLRGTRPHSLAEVEQRRLEWLEAQGFPAPRCAAWGARMRGWSEVDSFLLTAELDGMMALDEWLLAASSRLSTGDYRQAKRRHLLLAANLLADLHAQGFDHPFPYLRHFFVPAEIPAGGLPEDTAEARSDAACLDPASRRGRAVLPIAIIDVHSAVMGRNVSERSRERALAELFLSSLKAPVTHSDRLAFLKEYSGGRIDRERIEGILGRFAQKLRRHTNRYRWARETVAAMRFPKATPK
jgi:hypothetical protein